MAELDLGCTVSGIDAIDGNACGGGDCDSDGVVDCVVSLGGGREMEGIAGAGLSGYLYRDFARDDGVACGAVELDSWDDWVDRAGFELWRAGFACLRDFCRGMGDVVVAYRTERFVDGRNGGYCLIVHEESLSVRFSRPPGRVWSSVNGGVLTFGTSDIQADADCLILPEKSGEVLPAGWKLGFIQLQLAETNWAYYKGRTEAEGAVFVDSGVAARSVAVCRDTSAEGLIWYTGAGVADSSKETLQSTALPWKVPMFYFGDSPRVEIPVEFFNAQTGARNVLEEAKVSMSFLTTLSIRDPKLRYRHLRHFYWGLTWHARRAADLGGSFVYPLLPGSGGNCTQVKSGAPKDPKHCALLTDESRMARCCNEVASLAGMHPVVRSAAKWAVFAGMK